MSRDDDPEIRVTVTNGDGVGALFEASALATMLEDEQPWNPLVAQLQDALGRARQSLVAT